METSKPEYFTRHFDIINGKPLESRIVIVGAGAIGSFITLSLAKIGFTNITVIDFDTVDTENIGSQFYPVSAIGEHKVSALRDVVHGFTGAVIQPINRKISKSDKIDCDIFISAVDSMAVRSLLLDIVTCKWYIDPRMGAEYATMNVFDASTLSGRQEYKKTLFSDEDAVQERCTAKTTVYTVMLIAGQVVKAVKDLCMGNNPITSLEWSIKDNAMIAFSGTTKL